MRAGSECALGSVFELEGHASCVRVELRAVLARALQPGEWRSNIMKHWVPLTWSVTFLLLAAGACNRQDESSSSKTNVTSGRVKSPSPRASAVEAIAVARCDREARCDNLGDRKMYSDRAACLNEVRVQVDYDTTEGCVSGVNQANLAACLDQMKTVECAKPTDQSAPLTACRAGALCGP
jgi:hypothetical protein